MQFAIRAINKSNEMLSLSIDAIDAIDARRQAESKGLYVTEIKKETKRSIDFKFRLARQKLSVVLFSQELLALLNAGLSIVECLDALLEKESNSGTRQVLERLLESLKNGKRFSSALSEQPEQFPALYIGIVKAAEGTSDLPISLKRYIAYQQRVDGVRAKVVSAGIYPAILMLVGGAVSLFLIGYVVPKFSEVYQGSGRELPWMSQALLNGGQLISNHTGTFVLMLVCISVVLIFSLRHLVKSGAIYKLLHRIPNVGERVRVYELSRLYLTLGMLLEGGIPVVPAMETLRDIVSNGIWSGLNKAKEQIQSGGQFSAAFESNGLTTPISLRMLRVGERSGELGQMLGQSAAFYDEEITRWIDRFTKTFEPLLMALIGVVVGLIVVLLYMPIFDLAGSLS